ncbi:hypothetical protein HPP92_002897, partial [Vanilla planifolia]
NQPHKGRKGYVERFFPSTMLIFDFRFLALLAVGGSLAGSLLCFLNGCVFIVEAYKVYWTSCIRGVHTGNMVLRLVEAIDVYLAGTVMLIFAMGLYGLFISNVPSGVPSSVDRALKGSSLFGMFNLKERPKWMKISSLDELKTKYLRNLIEFAKSKVKMLRAQILKGHSSIVPFKLLRIPISND